MVWYVCAMLYFDLVQACLLWVVWYVCAMLYFDLVQACLLWVVWYVCAMLYFDLMQACRPGVTLNYLHSSAVDLLTLELQSE